MYKKIITCGLGLLLLASCDTPKKPLYLAVGSYADPTDSGIQLYAFDPQTGQSTWQSSVSGIKNPSYLTLSADQRQLYAVSETATPEAAVYAYQFDPQVVTLELINQQKVEGSDPCYIRLDPSGKWAITANYTGGNVSVLPIAADGSLLPLANRIDFEGGRPETERQQQPHLHGIFTAPDNRYLYATDLGTDRIYTLLPSENEVELLSTQTVQLPEGEGPRHLDFHPNGQFAYVLGELSGQVTVLAYQDGQFTPIQTVEADTLQAGGSADIHLTPDGRFLYASNRLQGDGLAIFEVDEATGRLTRVGYQPTLRHPRNFTITPNARFLLCASRDDNAIQVFSIDPATGLLKDTDQTIQTNKPVCLQFITITD